MYENIIQSQSENTHSAPVFRFIMGCHRGRRRGILSSPAELRTYYEKLAPSGGFALPSLPTDPNLKAQQWAPPENLDIPPDEVWDFLKNLADEFAVEIEDADLWQLIRWFNPGSLIFGPRDVIDDGSSDEDSADGEDEPPDDFPGEDPPLDGTPSSAEEIGSEPEEDVDEIIEDYSPPRCRAAFRPRFLKSFRTGKIVSNKTPFLDTLSSGISLPPPKNATGERHITKLTPLLQEALDELQSCGNHAVAGAIRAGSFQPLMP